MRMYNTRVDATEYAIVKLSDTTAELRDQFEETQKEIKHLKEVLGCSEYRKDPNAARLDWMQNMIDRLRNEVDTLAVGATGSIKRTRVTVRAGNNKVVVKV